MLISLVVWCATPQGSAPRRLARGERLTQSQRNKKMRNKAAQVELQKAKKVRIVAQNETAAWNLPILSCKTFLE